MNLRWVGVTYITVVEFHDGSTLEFPCNTWKKAIVHNKAALEEDDAEVSPCIFAYTNAYLSTLKPEALYALEELYREAYTIIIANTDVLAMNGLLHSVINSIMFIFNWEDFSQWCKTKANLDMSIGIKDTLGDNDSLNTTYFTEEYEDLVFFSILLKAILPIWGMYYTVVKDILGVEHTFISASDLIRNEYTDINPAYNKLEHYITQIATDRIKVAGFAVTNDIGTEEMPSYLLAVALWKKVCIFDPSDASRSIIKNVHAVIKDKCRRINTGGPNQKRGQNDSGDDISIVDNYKIIQQIPPAVEVMVTHYIRSGNLHLHVDSRIALADVARIRKNLPEDLEILDFYIPIVTAVCGTYIGNRNVLLLRHETLLDLLAVSSAALRLWGYLTLAQLLITPVKPVDYNSMAYYGGSVQIPLTPEVNAQLADIYRYAGHLRPGHAFVERITREINQYTFDITEGNINHCTTELAALLIQIAQLKLT